MATELSQVAIGAADRSDDVLRVELWRTLNSVGNWMAVLRNVNNIYDGVFDVQDQFLLDVNGLANTLMQGRVDGKAVTRIGQDRESIWDEYIVVRGVDQAQDLMFHNDFDYDYPDTAVATQQLHTVLNNVINIQWAGLTNITYVPPGASPTIGSVEFREGASSLTTIQEMFRTAGWLFYVDDVLALQDGAPGFSASGVTLQSILNDPNNNIIGSVEILDRDGDKLYNRIILHGKNPMFDGYTELNVPAVPGATGWHFAPVGGGMANDAATVRVGSHSVVAWNDAALSTHISAYYTLPYYNYTAFDFTMGELGIWARYDDTAGAPGAPPAGSMGAGGGWPNPVALWMRITDGSGFTAEFFGRPTMLYRGEWGYCRFPLGQGSGTTFNLIDEWALSNIAFDWSDIRELWFRVRPSGGFAAINYPSHLYLDGISMPEPCRSVVNDAVSQAAYRIRPYIDHFPNFRTQNSLDQQATRLLAQHKDTGISQIKLTTEGNPALRYAGQTIDINIPRIGLNTTVAYMTEIHHIIEPYRDVSEGYGFDWITEVTAIPINGTVYDMGRLRDGPAYGSMQKADRAGIGIGIK